MGELAATTACSAFRHHVGARGSNLTKFTAIQWRKTRKRNEICSNPLRIIQIHPASKSSTIPIIAAMANCYSAEIVTYSSGISTDIPLYEPPGVSFDEYMNDRPRVFKAMFPDQHRSKRLNNEEWRIQMLPLQFFLLTVNPVVVMQLRYISNGKEYPPSVPGDISSLLELRATKWELQGLDRDYMPSHFSLDVRGFLYPERRMNQSRLKGNLEISISCILPRPLALVPENILRGVAESVLRRLAERMKRECDVGFIADFRKFRREKLMKHKSYVGFSVNSIELRGET